MKKFQINLKNNIAKKNYNDLVQFTKLLKLGYSIQESLVLSIHLCHPQFIQDINQKLKNGDDFDKIILSLSLPHLFIEFYSFLIKKNSVLEALFQSITLYKKRTKIISDMSKRLKYPFFLVIFMFGFSVFVTIFLLPQVELLMYSFNQQIGLFQQVLFTLFKILPILFIVFIGLLIFIFCVIIYTFKYKRVDLLQKLLLLPKINKLIQQYLTLKFVIYYHELMLTGYDSTTIIDYLCNNVQNSDVSFLFHSIQKQMRNGIELLEIIDQSIYFEKKFSAFASIVLNQTKLNIGFENYIEIVIQNIDLKIRKYTQYFTMLIYFSVSIFVLTIYIAIIIPLMNVVTQL